MTSWTGLQYICPLWVLSKFGPIEAYMCRVIASWFFPSNGIKRYFNGPLITYLFKWEGSGALKICQGTTHNESKTNVALCQQILDDKELKTLYGVYHVTGGDVEEIVTMDSVKAKQHISSIMSSQRKPTVTRKRWNIQYMFSECFSSIIQNKYMYVVEHPYQPLSKTSH